MPVSKVVLLDPIQIYQRYRWTPHNDQKCLVTISFKHFRGIYMYIQASGRSKYAPDTSRSVPDAQKRKGSHATYVHLPSLRRIHQSSLVVVVNVCLLITLGGAHAPINARPNIFVAQAAVKPFPLPSSSQCRSTIPFNNPKFNGLVR